MSRVYLFADFGKGPRTKYGPWTTVLGADFEMVEPRIWKWRESARRWWLVECDSADAGRQAIAAFERPLKDYETPSALPCAIKNSKGVYARVLDVAEPNQGGSLRPTQKRAAATAEFGGHISDVERLVEACERWCRDEDGACRCCGWDAASHERRCEVGAAISPFSRGRILDSGGAS